MTSENLPEPRINRRAFFGNTAAGVGAMALSTLVGRESAASDQQSAYGAMANP